MLLCFVIDNDVSLSRDMLGVIKSYGSTYSLIYDILVLLIVTYQFTLLKFSSLPWLIGAFIKVVVFCFTTLDWENPRILLFLSLHMRNSVLNFKIMAQNTKAAPVIYSIFY